MWGEGVPLGSVRELQGDGWLVTAIMARFPWPPPLPSMDYFTATREFPKERADLPLWASVRVPFLF